MNPRRVGALTTIALAALAARAHALDPARSPSQYRRDSFGVAHGLPSNAVRAVLPASDGYVWIATSDGLARFDGIRFSTVDRTVLPALKDHDVGVLHQDPQGALWVAAGSTGVIGTLSHQSGPALNVRWNADSAVRALVTTDDGALWAGTGRGLRRRAANGAIDQPLRQPVWALQVDGQRTLWVGTKQGLFRSTAEGLREEPLLAGQSVRALAAREDQLWAGTDAGGIARLIQGKASWVSPGPFAHQRVYALVEDPPGTLWAGTSVGLFRLHDDVWTRVIADVQVTALATDREGGLWLGLADAGVMRLRDRRFDLHGADAGLRSPVTAVHEAPDGSVWVGTHDAGVLRFADGRFTPQGHGLPHPRVRSLAITARGEVFAVTWDETLSRLRDGRWERITIPREVQTIAAAADGTIWASAGSVFVVPPGASSGVRLDETDNAGVRVALPASEGRVWFGDQRGGIRRLEAGTGTNRTWHHEPASDLQPSPVLALLEDRRDQLWIGTSTGGLLRRTQRGVARVDVRGGLADNRVTSLLDDGAGRLWLGSARAISWVYKDELEALLDGRAPRVASVVYGAEEDLTASHAVGTWPTSFRGRDGRLWFASDHGLVEVNPRALRSNAPAPRVAIEEVFIDGARVDAARTPQLPSGPHTVEVRYTGLSFTAPERISFRHRLQGETWVDASTRRVAHLAGLGPGTYRFEVMARNVDGLWSSNVATFSFHVALPLHRRPWFFALIAALAAAGLFGAHRLRLARLRDRYAAVLEERSRIAREMHDTLAQAFVAVSFELESARRALDPREEKAALHLARAHDAARASIAEARRSILALRSHALLEADLAQAFGELAARFAEGTVVSVEVVGPPRRLEPTMEHELFRIGGEAITNALRHSGAARIRIRLAFEPRRFVMVVSDDGRGLPEPAGEPQRHGLQGMKERAERIGARLEIAPGASGGTDVRVEIAS